MSLRKDVNGMSDRELLSEIYNKVEILDDIVRGDRDRNMKGLQEVVGELRTDLEPLRKGRIMRQSIITSAAAIITTLASIATVLTLVWQVSGQ